MTELRLPPGPFYSCESGGSDFSCAHEYSFPAEDLKWYPSIEKWICFNCADEEQFIWEEDHPDEEWIEPTQTLEQYLLTQKRLEEREYDIKTK